MPLKFAPLQPEFCKLHVMYLLLHLEIRFWEAFYFYERGYKSLLACVRTITLMLVQENGSLSSSWILGLYPGPWRVVRPHAGGSESASVCTLLFGTWTDTEERALLDQIRNPIFCCEEVKMLTLSMPSAVGAAFARGLCTAPALTGLWEMMDCTERLPRTARGTSPWHIAIPREATVAMPALQFVGYFVQSVLTRRKGDSSQKKPDPFF